MKLLYVLLIVLLTSKVFAQTYLPIPESNAIWIESSYRYFGYNNHEHATITQPLSFGNDSLIGGVNFHTLHGHAIADWIDGWGNQQLYQEGTDYIADAIQVVFRQDIPNKLVYQWDNNSNQEQILYDFGNLVVGQPYPQTLNNMDYPLILVMEYDSVLLNDGLYHERWTLGTNSNDSGFVAIIEGMGATTGFFFPIAIPFEQTSATMCFTKDGNSVYDAWGSGGGIFPPRYSENCTADLNVLELTANGPEISVWPLPAQDVVTVESSEFMEKLVVFDLIGNRILEQALQNELKTELSLGNLPAGNYILKVYTENNVCTSKRIVR